MALEIVFTVEDVGRDLSITFRMLFFTNSNTLVFETVLQLLDDVQTHILNGTEQKEILKRNPLAVDYADTGLKGFQQNAFMTAYAFVMKR